MATVIGGTLSADLTLTAGTYHVTSKVTFNGFTVTFDATDGPIYIKIDGDLVAFSASDTNDSVIQTINTTQTNKVIFTKADDDTLGEVISSPVAGAYIIGVIMTFAGGNYTGCLHDLEDVDIHYCNGDGDAVGCGLCHTGSSGTTTQMDFKARRIRFLNSQSNGQSPFLGSTSTSRDGQFDQDFQDIKILAADGNVSLSTALNSGCIKQFSAGNSIVKRCNIDLDVKDSSVYNFNGTDATIEPDITIENNIFDATSERALVRIAPNATSATTVTATIRNNFFRNNQGTSGEADFSCLYAFEGGASNVLTMTVENNIFLDNDQTGMEAFKTETITGLTVTETNNGWFNNTEDYTENASTKTLTNPIETDPVMGNVDDELTITDFALDDGYAVTNSEYYEGGSGTYSSLSIDNNSMIGTDEFTAHESTDSINVGIYYAVNNLVTDVALQTRLMNVIIEAIEGFDYTYDFDTDHIFTGLHDTFTTSRGRSTLPSIEISRAGEGESDEVTCESAIGEMDFLLRLRWCDTKRRFRDTRLFQGWINQVCQAIATIDQKNATNSASVRLGPIDRDIFSLRTDLIATFPTAVCASKGD